MLWVYLPGEFTNSHSYLQGFYDNIQNDRFFFSPAHTFKFLVNRFMSMDPVFSV